ncbi:MAG TPA: hypothetical protein VJM78_02420 [Rhizomicrobium sp.]|nr:hypothetical protein [Rhizomicrobium sp.]
MKSKILLFIFSVAAVLTPVWAATDDIPWPAVVKSVRHEFRGIRYNYFGPNWLVNEQIIMGLGIPNPARHVADGNTLVSGCRPHSCDEKSAVIVTPAGAMLAAGLIYLSCDGDLDKKIPAVDCKLRPRLRIFMKQKNDRPALAQELKDWAAREGFAGAAEKQILRP